MKLKSLQTIFVKSCTRIYFSENYIDGGALAVVPHDFEEFRLLVPQSGLRIKLKAAIEKYYEFNPSYSQVHVQ